MSALADTLRALMPFAEEWRDGDPALTARDALRKHTPCGVCGGSGFHPLDSTIDDLVECPACSGEGWTPASVDAAIKRDEERARLDAAVIRAVGAFCIAGGGAISASAALADIVEAHGERQSVLGGSNG